MERLPVNFLIGFLLGCVFTIIIYDCFAMRDYKETISKYKDALDEANSVIIQKIGENDTLKRYLLEIARQDRLRTKKI